ncbi:MAG: hypothetical protein M1818_003646 [Claussenomyces sp. TS43310]|nr:MAG: hypothetical protein M1818_003646 [Claussenomyces sp. TS43310]
MKRGNAHLCRKSDPPTSSEKAHPVSTSPNSHLSPSNSNTIGDYVAPVDKAAVREVSALAERVKQLETVIQAQKRPYPSDSADLDASSSALVQSKYARASNASSRQASRRPSPLRRDDGADDGGSSAESAPDAEVENAATVLEFLAWGRLKSDFPYTMNQSNLGLPTAPLADADMNANGAAWALSPPSISGGAYSTVESSRIQLLQDLLPKSDQVLSMVNFHIQWLLWVHTSFHGPTFMRELHEFYGQDQGTILPSSGKMQWIGLLFAILSTSLACAKPARVTLWGFREGDRNELAKRWYHAAIECMRIGRCEQSHNINAVQAFGTMTWSAHLLGFSNTQSVMLASAVRVAQSLGLHRLIEDRRQRSQDIDHSLAGKTQRETGRRLWQQLAQQDWFSVPFSETYSINPLHYTSKLPLNCDDETLERLPDTKPAMTTYSNFLHEIACLMPKLLDKMSEARTLHGKYEQVMLFDRKMRDLATHQLPPTLNCQVPIDPTWPCWIPLARRSLTATSAHKIIMIHRRFLGISLTDPRFAFTRRTCLAAAKTILGELRQEQADEAPILWTMQAFSVAAAIILSLDNFNRPQRSPEYAEHKQLIMQTMNILSTSASFSSIASRGVRLLGELLAEEQNARAPEAGSSWESGKGKQIASQDGLKSPNVDKKPSLNVSAFVKKFCETDQPPAPTSPILTSHVPIWLRPENQPYATPGEEMYYSSNPPPMDPYAQVDAPAPYHPAGLGPPTATFSVNPPGGFSNAYPTDYTDFTQLGEVRWINDLLGFAPSHTI